MYSKCQSLQNVEVGHYREEEEETVVMVPLWKPDQEVDPTVMMKSVSLKKKAKCKKEKEKLIMLYSKCHAGSLCEIMCACTCNRKDAIFWCWFVLVCGAIE